MAKINLKDYVVEFRDMWLGALITQGRAFPDYRDGLKDSTRSILTSVARRADFKRTPIKGDILMGDVPAYKEAAEKSISKIIFRMASTENPLINVVSKDSGGAQGLNRITGNHSRPSYIAFSLSPMGEYAFKYRKYFTTHSSDVDGETQKIDYLKTPLPLSLLIPQVNLSDGFSNKAPNLNVGEVLDAYIEHLSKNKETTTEDLTKHIKGFDLNKGTKILMTNQSLHDLIERGVSKVVALSPIKFHEGEMLIQEFPFRLFGNTIRDQFQKLHRLPPNKGGFESFQVTGYSAEESDESMITINYTINKGFTIKDVKKEIYKKTFLKENLVYENLCLDFDNERPLTIKSVRSVLDYHVDLGIELKQREVKDKLEELEEQKEEAEFLEKLTRQVCVDIIGRIIGLHNRDEMAEKYLNNIHAVIRDLTLGKMKDSELLNYTHIHSVILKTVERLRSLTASKSPTREFDEEIFMEVLDQEIPTPFTQNQLAKLWNKKFEVLYDLNKRKKAIGILTTYSAKLKRYQEMMGLENIKKELIKEIKDLRKHYPNDRTTETMYAVRAQEREVRREIKRHAVSQIKRMDGKVPVNVLLDKDMVARISINPEEVVPNLHTVFQVTTDDILVVFNRVGQSRKIPVSELTVTGKKIGEKEDVLAVTVSEINNNFYVFVTNKGRVILCNKYLMAFREKLLDIALAENEFFIYHDFFPMQLYSDKISLILKTEDNLIKKKLLNEIKVKERLSDFFNVFAGNSYTDLVTCAELVPSSGTSFKLWTDEGLQRASYISGFKRNVSFGEKLVFDKSNAITIGDKIPHLNGRIITSLNALANETSFNTLSPILHEINHDELNAKLSFNSVNEIQWAKLMTSSDRREMNLGFIPDEVQTKYLLKRFKSEAM